MQALGTTAPLASLLRSPCGMFVRARDDDTGTKFGTSALTRGRSGRIHFCDFCLNYGNEATIQDGHFSVTSRFQMMHMGARRGYLPPGVIIRYEGLLDPEFPAVKLMAWIEKVLEVTSPGGSRSIDT